MLSSFPKGGWAGVCTNMGSMMQTMYVFDDLAKCGANGGLIYKNMDIYLY